MSMSKPVPFRPLGVLKMLIEGQGLEVTHCYEDLVFVEHNAFLLRMEEKGEEVSLFFNTESDIEKRDEIAGQLATEGKKYSLIITSMGTYTMTPNEAEGTLHLAFQEE
ncbi:MAG: hypothetical protein WBB19_19770 [Desulforhopalus sp.]